MVLRNSDWNIKRDRVVAGTCGKAGVFLWLWWKQA
jgi:hypothetical protein